ncbi:MAG: hypothetical protein CMF22_12150 [Idiomarinaceae bacterium]|nr:hypothetical protein [Idiomarinaceae bacterium]|tara:strand:+ start:154822 stop:155103 length:282 start_codon:yes stop_codon:yes gene_type:complete
MDFEELIESELAKLDLAIEEGTVRTVDSRGNTARKKDRKTRKRRAVRTTGMSASALRKRAKKAAKTRARDVSGQRKAVKRRKKAMRIRKQRGL